MKKIAGISLALLLCSASCDTSTKPVFDGGDSATASIAHLKTLCHGSSTVIAEELEIGGVVTANDIMGEFPRTIVIEDASGGIEIALDQTFLANLFPLGAAVTVSCTGLAIGEYGGKVRLGAPSTGPYSTDRIPSADIGRYIRLEAMNAHTRRPRTLRFEEIGIADADTYVRFEHVRFTEAGHSWCDRDPESGGLTASRRTLIDAAGNTFPVRVTPGCDYAKAPVPQGTGTVNGIVDYFNGEFSLRIVNYEIALATSAMLPTACPSTAECSIPIPTR